MNYYHFLTIQFVLNILSFSYDRRNFGPTAADQALTVADPSLQPLKPANKWTLPNRPTNLRTALSSQQQHWTHSYDSSDIPGAPGPWTHGHTRNGAASSDGGSGVVRQTYSGSTDEVDRASPVRRPGTPQGVFAARGRSNTAAALVHQNSTGSAPAAWGLSGRLLDFNFGGSAAKAIGVCNTFIDYTF